MAQCPGQIRPVLSTKICRFFIFYFNALNFIHKSTNLPHFSRKTRTAKIMTPNLQNRRNHRANKSNSFKYNFKNV